MQNEDDLRGLAKVMDFMRAISILFVVINIYWFCYQSFREWGINIGVVDKILLNFQRTAGLFSNILYTKLFSVVFLALSCLGTKGVKEEKITWNKIYVFLTIGFILFFLTVLAHVVKSRFCACRETGTIKNSAANKLQILHVQKGFLIIIIPVYIISHLVLHVQS